MSSIPRKLLSCSKEPQRTTFDKLESSELMLIIRQPKMKRQKRSKRYTRARDLATLTLPTQCSNSQSLLLRNASSSHDTRDIEMFQGTCHSSQSPVVYNYANIATDEYGTKGGMVLCSSINDMRLQEQQAAKYGYNTTGSLVSDNEKNALVPLKGDDRMIPYDGRYNSTKERLHQPKGDLDLETNSERKLLMGEEASEARERTVAHQEKWWEKERWIFCGRANSFNARMHQLQGDRRFSKPKWNRSVLDSVVGKEELKNKKVFVQHFETVSSSDATVDILQSFVPGSSDSSEVRTKVVERKRIFKEGIFLANGARFEQIWSSRKGSKETIDDGLREICHLYDVVRVDGEEEKSHQMGEPKDISMEESTILCNYLPLIREFLPSVAEEIQSDMQSYLSNQGSADDYVYDLYTVQDELNTTDENSLNTFPLVQVNEDDDFYDGPMQSDYESDDSNAEDNPLNEYPYEETSEDEDDGDKSRTSCEESEIGSSDDQSDELQDKPYDNLGYKFGNEDLLYEEEVSGDDDYDGDGGQ